MGKDMLDFGNGPLTFSAPIRSERGVPIVEVRGELDLATVPELLRAIGTAGSRMDDRALMVVDLRNAEFVDAFGAWNLLDQAQAMRELGGELRLVIPEAGLAARVFELLEIEQIFELYYEIPALPDKQRAS